MTNAFAELSNAMAETVATASNSLVRVEARRRLPASGIIWDANGVIVTANHIVRHDDKIHVGLPDGRRVPATLVGRDPTTDLAVLQVEASGLTTFVESEKSELAVGHLVLALGRPGKSVQATLGVLSAVGDSWRTGMGGMIDHYVQTDVLMYPGFSGGALVNGNGRLLGLNTSALAQGVSLTIPTVTLARVASDLLAHGRVKRGYLGVSTQRVHLPATAVDELGQKDGLLIVGVEPDSPAEAGGLTLGDTIVALAGEPIHRHDDLMAQLSGDRVATAVAVQFLRGGQVQTLDITIGEK